MWKHWLIAYVVLLLHAAPSFTGELKVSDFKTQQVGETTYFRVQFENPDDLQIPKSPIRGRLTLTRLPRLVPQDNQTDAVHLYLSVASDESSTGLAAPKRLDFFGRLQKKGTAKFRLLYPVANDLKIKVKESPIEKVLREHNGWKEVPVTLDFANAEQMASPKTKRAKDQPPNDDDFEGKWAVSKASRFAILESLTPQFGFYSLARESLGRLYHVPAPPLPAVAEAALAYDPMNVYGLMTATSLITEALALDRLTKSSAKKQEARTVDIKNVPGVEAPEHPWKKMMDGKKSSAAPVTKMIPHDNYYLHFKNISKLIEFADWLEPTGNTAAQLFSPFSRDDRIKQRYEQQLCIEMNFLARLFGPAIVKNISITGSDPYVREGSDVTVILNVASRRLFLFGANNYISRTQKKWGDKLKVSKEKLGNISIDRYVTPLREVSLHRAIFDDFIIYSNSKIALNRVLETHLGKRKSLSESPDFQYMRTVFSIEDKKEEGFLFLSGAFVRNLVGPALRIKERRRLEAITSLQMATHGALYTAWNQGKLPANHKQMLAATGLTADHLNVPGSDPVTWNPKEEAAVSKVYNTIHFATPLIELAIDKITPSEQREYDTLRKEYLAKFEDYLEPIGIRFAIDKEQVRVEVLVTPLTNNDEYQWLRDLSPGGKVAVHPDLFDPNALIQAMAYVSPNSPQAKSLMAALRRLVSKIPPIPWLGDFITVKLDDNDVLEQYAEQKILEKLGVKKSELSNDLYYVAKLPLSGGVSVQRPIIFRGVLLILQAALGEAFPGSLEWRPLPLYKGVSMVRVRVRNNGLIGNLINGDRKTGRITPTLYYAMFDRQFYMAQNADSLKRIIDHKLQLQRRPPEESEITKANVTIQVSPAAAKKAQGYLHLAAAWETHHRALSAAAHLFPLYRGNILTSKSSTADTEAKAWQFFGFVPVSADQQPFFYSKSTGEVVNKTHGSLRKPQFSRAPAGRSPTSQLLDQFRWLRADIHFEENGLRLVTTLRKR